MPKQIISGVIAREAIKKGVDQLANAVKITLGPRGRNVILDKGFLSISQPSKATPRGYAKKMTIANPVPV